MMSPSADDDRPFRCDVSTQTANILVVDDDDDVRANVVDILRMLGYAVTEAANAESALRAIDGSEFAVALLDFKMPGMDGASLYETIRARSPSTVAIMVTAWSGSDGARRALDAGAWSVMSKPIDVQRLIDQIDAAIHAGTGLLVDDDEELCHTLWDALNHERYRVSIASDAAAAEKLLASEHFDFALIDVHLGRNDGRNLLSKIHDSEDRPTKVWLISGDAEALRSFPRPGIDLTPDTVMTKPIDLERLLRSLRPVSPTDTPS